MDFDAQVAKPDWTAATKMLDSPPAGYFTAAEIQKKRAQIQASWDDAFKPLPAKGEWEAAKKMLAGAPAHLFGQTELDERLTRIQKPWSDAFEALLAKNDLDEAGKMLDQAARVELFPKPILEERRATLKDGEYRKWLAAFDKAFSELVDGGKFLEAKKKLDDAVARERLRSEGIQSRTKSLRKQWLQWIVAHWDKSDQAEKLKVEIAEFLKASPEPSEANDARLLRARALVHLGKQTSAEQTVSDARKDLLVLVEAAGLAPDRAYVRDALLVIASVNKPEDFRRTYPKEPENFAAPWQLDPWEKKELEGRPPPSPAMEPGSGIATIKKAIETLHDPQAKPDAARPLLEALEKSYPTASPGSWKVDQEDDLALLTGSVPAVLGKLAAGVAVVGPAKYPDQAKDLGRAKDWLLAAKSRFPVPEIGAAIHAVATRRLALRAWEEPKPRQADLQELEEWDQSSKGQAKAAADAEELMAKAWRAECNVVLGQNILSARNNLMLIKAPLLAKQPAYTRYLWCRALKAAGSGTDSIVQELNELAPALEGPEPILKAQDRAAAMAELIVEAAREQRKQFRPWKLEKIPFNSFSAPAEAEQYARLLKAAGKLVADENRQRELKLGLALAEFHGPKPEMARVWSLTRELLPLRDVGVEPDLVPLLFAGVSSFWQQPSPANLSADDPQFVAAVGATTQLLRELGKDEAGKMTKEGPKAVYDSVLKPLLEGPEFQKKTEAQKQAGNQHLSELAGAVAQLLENQQDAQWPLPKGVRSVHHAIESQATLAIELAPKDKPDSARLADYYAMRAGARAYKPDLNVPEVLGDVETALKHQPKLHRALGVRAYALIMRAGEQPKRDQILRDLTDAIAAGEEAVKSCPEHNKAYPLHMLNLGSAHLTLGNYVTDAKKKQEHLGKARDCASQAAKLVHEYADDARLLLGNIYEDLASQVGQDPKKNYLEAKKWFSEALQRNPLSAQALCSLARCSFKAVVKSRLNPRELDLGDRDAALAACLKDLDKATKYALKDAIRIEAFSYLGQVYEEQGDWARADENIGKAAELAKQSEASTRAAYVAAWAMLPVTQASRLQATRTADDPEVMKLFQTAEQRAKELQGMPAGAFVVPAKQVAVILGATRQRRKEFDKAAEAYDQALPKDLAETDALDVSLLLARADCNLSRPGANKEAAFAQAAIRDASRALELAPAGPEQAGAHYRLALAHFSLFGQGGNPAIQHRDKSLESIREAVRLAPLGANGVTYRKTGATLIANVIAEVAKADPKQAIPFYEEAERWLKEALDLVQDPAEKKAIEAILKLFQDVLGKLRGGPAPAPTPKSGE
jgi:hypothetical protein